MSYNRQTRQFYSSYKRWEVKQSCFAYKLQNYLSTKNYSKNINTLHPMWVTGFIDGEGCFHVSVNENKKYRLGWKVQLNSQILLHGRDFNLLKHIQAKLNGVGSICEKRSGGSILFQVQSIKDLKVIIDHFSKYPLITQKCYDFKLFEKAVHLVELKEHLTYDGLRKIVAIKASMNLGLSDVLKKALDFPYVVKVNKA